jgi:hypothetical protein
MNAGSGQRLGQQGVLRPPSMLSLLQRFARTPGRPTAEDHIDLRHATGGEDRRPCAQLS